MAEAATGHPGGGDAPDGSGTEPTRRDVLYLTTAAVTAMGVAAFAWPLVDSMNPAADTLALSTVDVDLSPIAVGQSITVMWRGKPVFVRHRTPEEIAEAEAVPLSALRDPETDSDRVLDPQWLVQIGICTHLGCVPLGQKPTDPKGDFNGWFCPCHGSHYDTSGRIRRGPAPLNLPIPEYAFLDETSIRLG
jgi:ubiquinol-cytochrome c reductase iron-sulfur subunit